MRFFDLLHPDTKLSYRLGMRELAMPGFPTVRERVLVPLVYINSTPVPMVTTERPILSAFPPGHAQLPVGATRMWLIDHGWQPAE